MSQNYHQIVMVVTCERATVRNMKKAIYNKLLWGLPMSLFAVDANAWGLYTHILFSQWMMATIPLLDPKVRLAIKKFPKLVMAGACLPDLAVISKAFNTTHQWEKAELLIKNASSEEEVAIAIGYSSHLFVDVIAHNHFVPAHEAKWVSNQWLNTMLNENHVTHITSEWAMDAHIAQHIPHCPHHLILAHLETLSTFVAPCFGVTPRLAKKKLRQLAWADGLLRASGLSSIMLWLLKLKDAEFTKNLNYYLANTSEALMHFDKPLQGQRPNWQPELHHLNMLEMTAWREKCLNDLSERLSVPIEFFHTKIL
jgi:Zinc dependent phospholipase C